MGAVFGAQTTPVPGFLLPASVVPMTPPPHADASATRLIDSPWLWCLLFSVMAFVGTAIIGPKFALRQGQLERRYQGQARAAIERERRRAGLAPVDLADAAHAPADLSQASAAERIIPLWTLATAAGTAAVGSAAMLWRERRRAAGCTPSAPCRHSRE